MNRERWNKWKNLIGRKEESSEEYERGENKFENVGAGCCSRRRPSPRPKERHHVSTLQVDLHF